ncbi:hypothetical protein AB1Y20_015152 [Prymnesium parvum]|uniref:Uncharacterized protein n=1 Tax=Prymnesium parvum TaxID=97485 RepID=A0AB34JX04_PRYPA
MRVLRSLPLAASATAWCAGKQQTWPNMGEGEGKVFHGPDGKLTGVMASLNYQEPGVKAVWTRRDESGSDDELHGARFADTSVMIHNGRGEKLALFRNGFELHSDLKASHIDYYSEEQILSSYYPQCEALVQKAMGGAARVVAFDHNVRCAGWKDSGRKLDGGNAVQGPAGLVHADYTAVSGPRRFELLAEPPKVNDVKQPKLPLEKGDVAGALAGARRWAFVNVWRPISTVPVMDRPLACCDAQSVTPDDLLTFEIRYVDRTGENYFAKHAPGHKWYYFPQMTRDEALLLLQWDSKGDFAVQNSGSGGGTKESEASTGSATFALHSAFLDPSRPVDSPPRESIEVRCVVIFND